MSFLSFRDNREYTASLPLSPIPLYLPCYYLFILYYTLYGLLLYRTVIPLVSLDSGHHYTNIEKKKEERAQKKAIEEAKKVEKRVTMEALQLQKVVQKT